MTDPILVLSTCDTADEAERIATVLVEERLAACVNIIPGLTSIYRWHGVVERAAEQLLLIKTTGEQRAALEERLGEIHSYEVPEILELPITGGNQKYLTWLRVQVAAV
ncbi:MAG TPA: divalent-cation tolerance protein CutA [Bryobacteraceae bacterium]|nr:divalent-cation tolerance protein CutA [Bryobacteraceae bacterium]